MAKITFTFGGESREVELGDGETVFGRSAEATVRIQDSGVSRAHAVFRRTPKGWEVEDLRSSNGTFVNGKQVERCLLRDGDRVKLNNVEMEFEDVPAAPTVSIAMPAPPPEAAPLPVMAKPVPPPLPQGRAAQGQPDISPGAPSPPPAVPPAVPPALQPPAVEEAFGTRPLSPDEVADALRKARNPAVVEGSTRQLDPDEVMETLKRLRAAAGGSPAAAAPMGPPRSPPVEEGPGGTRAVDSDELRAAWKQIGAGPSGTRPISSILPAPRAPGPSGTLPGPGPTGTRPTPASEAAPAAAASSVPATTEEMLGRVPLFAGVAPALLKTIAEESQFHVFAPRAVICREGEYTADFYVLLSGMIGVYKADPAQRDRVLHLASLPPGSFFGEMSCMSHAPRSATVIAESDVVAVSIPRHTFLKVYGDRKSPKFKEVIDKAYRERALRNHLSSLAIFRGLDAAILSRVGEKAELLIAEKGTVLAGEGKAADGVYLVRTGHAKLVSRPGPGEEILAWYCENSFFGVKTLVDDVAAGTSMIAVDRMDLVRIPAAALEALVLEFPDLRKSILDNAAAAGRPAAAASLSEEEAEARRRAREIGAGSEVIKAGDALVIDMSKCTRCNMCVEGCIDAHEDHIPRIGKRGLKYGDLLLTSSCYNCKVPDCMLACKFGAIRRDRKGQVQIDPDACTGCSLCEPACPYGTIHMQSLVDDEGVRTRASAGPIKDLLRSLPVVGKLLWKDRVLPAKTGPVEPLSPAALAAASAAPAEKKEERKKLRLAVKCDLCAGRSDMACIASCPCGAIERIDPSYLLQG